MIKEMHAREFRASDSKGFSFLVMALVYAISALCGWLSSSGWLSIFNPIYTPTYISFLKSMAWSLFLLSAFLLAMVSLLTLLTQHRVHTWLWASSGILVGTMAIVVFLLPMAQAWAAYFACLETAAVSLSTIYGVTMNAFWKLACVTENIAMTLVALVLGLLITCLASNGDHLAFYWYERGHWRHIGLFIAGSLMGLGVVKVTQGVFFYSLDAQHLLAILFFSGVLLWSTVVSILEHQSTMSIPVCRILSIERPFDDRVPDNQKIEELCQVGYTLDEIEQKDSYDLTIDLLELNKRQLEVRQMYFKNMSVDRFEDGAKYHWKKNKAVYRCLERKASTLQESGTHQVNIFQLPVRDQHRYFTEDEWDEALVAEWFSEPSSGARAATPL